MINSPSYDKAIIYKALNAIPEDQLKFLRDFFISFVPETDISEVMTDAEYDECMAIIQNSSDDDWFDLDNIDA